VVVVLGVVQVVVVDLGLVVGEGLVVGVVQVLAGCW